MNIAIASGKGGTGKTTVAVNLALAAKKGVQLIDCDVEEPNIHLFVKGEEKHERRVNILIPEIIESRCIAEEGCDLCSQFCEFNAIVCPGKLPIIIPEMCHGCGGCKRACPKKAIREVPYEIGTVTTSKHKDIFLAEGRLDIGMSLAPAVIKGVKEEKKRNVLSLLDAPPGTSCPVVSVLQGCDFVILVTEPTPFGLNDLRLAVDMVRELGLRFGVVINRANPEQSCIDEYCAAEEIQILAAIPEDRKIAQSYAKGIPIIEALPEYRAVFETLLCRIKEAT
jgi:MinD superfamily P-loop ATPase